VTGRQRDVTTTTAGSAAAAAAAAGNANSRLAARSK